MIKISPSPWDDIALELTVHCRKHFRPPKSSNPILTPTLSSIQQLRYFQEPRTYIRYSKEHLKTLQKTRMRMIPNPYRAHANSIKPTSNEASLKISKKMENPRIMKYRHILMPHLRPSSRKLLKKAKNLQSLIVGPGCEKLILKEIRRIRGLQSLELTIQTSQILAYPHLFKRFTALQKVTIFLSWSSWTPVLPIDKFFGFLINLPKLQHLTLGLDGALNYYKTLLAAIHKRKLASFHILVLGNLTLPQGSKSDIDGGKYTDTLYLGPIPSLENRLPIQWLPAQKPERILRLNKIPEIDDLMEEEVTIKNLEIFDFFYLSGCLNARLDDTLLEFISRTKTLKNLTLACGEVSMPSDVISYDFNRKLSEIDSLESLENFAFSLTEKVQHAWRVSPPFSSKMKNLKVLSINMTGWCLDLSSLAEALKDLAQLENFSFRYMESAQIFTRNKLHHDYNFPFGQLLNLKAISLYCKAPNSQSSVDRLVESLVQVENLEFLEIEGHVLNGLERKKASGFIEDLRLMKNLEVARFSWKETESNLWAGVLMKKVNGEMVVSSKREI